MSPKGALKSPAIRNADLPRERGKSEEPIRKLQEMQIDTGEHPATFARPRKSAGIYTACSLGYGTGFPLSATGAREDSEAGWRYL